jgi:NADPH-dependent stearoyl-CoA 9-desaturase
MLDVLVSGSKTRRARAAKQKLAEAPVAPPLQFASDDQRIAEFGRALDALKAEVEAALGEEDAKHILGIGKLSRRMEVAGRTLLQLSFDPVTFSLATGMLFVHKALELMEIGHPALHGCYDGLPGCEKYASASFDWKTPVDEGSWKKVHNVKHHQFTNIVGKDPDMNFAMLRLSARVPYQLAHLLQPISNVFTWFGFGTALNLHVTGMLDIYVQQGQLQVLPDLQPATVANANKLFFSKMARHYGREYVLFPLLAGPFAGKVFLGNLLSEVARDLWAAAIIYCGHVGARDYPEGTEPPTRAHWYALQAEAGRDCDVPEFVSILCGALDKQIEHHLFPRLPPNRLRQIAPRVRELCKEYGIEHRHGSWRQTLGSVLSELFRLSAADAKAEEPSYMAPSAYAAE